MGKGQGSEGGFNRYTQTQDVASRTQTHCRRTESTLGQVAPRKEISVTRYPGLRRRNLAVRGTSRDFHGVDPAATNPNDGRSDRV